jgi:uncharacterized OsmC-like protein
MSEVVSRFTLSVDQVEGFEFRVRFDKDQYAELRMDEPEPLGRDAAPNPARILAASIANCLAASLTFCMKRAGAPLESMHADVDVEMVRNEQKRMRVGKVNVRLAPTLSGDISKYERCLGIFEDYCIVTQSVREGLDVEVHVEPREARAAS